MNGKYLLLGLLVCLLVSAMRSQAHTLGPTLVRLCPHCRTELAQYTSSSGNTMGARHWTDGYVRAPMLPFRPQLVKCPDCRKRVWFEDAKLLAPVRLWGRDWPNNAKAPLEAVEADYLAAAAAPGLARERERHARWQAWWLANHPARETGNPSPEWSPVRRANLDRLAALLDERNDCERILKAEMVRELGRFDECLKLLATPVGDECAELARRVRKLALEGSTRVEECCVDGRQR